MTKEMYSLYSKVKSSFCDDCDASGMCSKQCAALNVLNAIKAADAEIAQQLGEAENQGCQYCTDKKGKTNTIYWDDNRGGYRDATFCPNCGKRLH